MLLTWCPYLILTETNTLSVSVPDGKPVIDFIPDLPNILIATGHEGNGLTLVSHLSLYQFAPVASVSVLDYFFLFS